MSDKLLAVRPSQPLTTVGNTGARQSISPHDDLDVLVDQLLRRRESEGGGTVDEVLRHPQVKKHGMLGRLSSGQQSLVTSVVSLMQDRVATDARKNADALKQIIIHEREALSHMSRSFADTAKHLYQLPLLGRARHDAPIEHDEIPRANVGGGVPPQTVSPPSVWERFLTWGNLLAGTAIVLAVLVVKTSVDTASYKTQYELTLKNLEQTQAERDELKTVQQQINAENKSLAEQKAALQTRVESQEKQQQIEQQRFASEQSALTRQLEDARQSIARQQTQFAQMESTKTVGQARSSEQISALQQQVANLKGQQSQQDESAQLWKKMAEERQQEISRLQAELRQQTLVKTSKPDEKKGIFGLF